MENLKEFLKNKKLLDKYNAECKEFENKKNKMNEKIDMENFFAIMTEITQAASKMFTFECTYKLEQLLNNGVEFIDLNENDNLGIFNYSITADGVQLREENKFNSNIPFDLFLKDAQSLGFLENDPKINVRELQEYFYRIIQKGIYKSEYYKKKAFKKIFCLFEEKNNNFINSSNIYHGETAIITKRPYMLNDCSKFKSGLYQFLMSNDIKFKSDMKLSNSNKIKMKENFI